MKIGDSGGDWEYVDGFGKSFVPDIRIRKNDSTYCYRPCRGNAATVAIEDINGNIIGWMSVDDLPGGPFKDVRDWMEKVHYVIRTEF